jgi:hypothetical protein
LTVPKYGGVLVGPDPLRQVFNDTDAGVLWLIVGAPEELEFLPGAKTKPDLSLIYPTDAILSGWNSFGTQTQGSPKAFGATLG